MSITAIQTTQQPVPIRGPDAIRTSEPSTFTLPPSPSESRPTPSSPDSSTQNSNNASDDRSRSNDPFTEFPTVPAGGNIPVPTEDDQPIEGDEQNQIIRQPGEERLNKNENNTRLSMEERKKVRKLRKVDRQVRAHEQAHLSAAGQYATGGANFQFQEGPDGNLYAVAGEVQLDTSKEDTPEQTIKKMRTIKRAALAPAEPSSQDRQVAAQASQKLRKAQQEQREQRQNPQNKNSHAVNNGEPANNAQNTNATQRSDQSAPAPANEINRANRAPTVRFRSDNAPSGGEIVNVLA